MLSRGLSGLALVSSCLRDKGPRYGWGRGRSAKPRPRPPGAPAPRRAGQWVPLRRPASAQVWPRARGTSGVAAPGGTQTGHVPKAASGLHTAATAALRADPSVLGDTGLVASGHETWVPGSRPRDPPLPCPIPAPVQIRGLPQPPGSVSRVLSSHSDGPVLPEQRVSPRGPRTRPPACGAGRSCRLSGHPPPHSRRRSHFTSKAADPAPGRPPVRSARPQGAPGHSWACRPTPSWPSCSR